MLQKHVNRIKLRATRTVMRERKISMPDASWQISKVTGSSKGKELEQNMKHFLDHMKTFPPAKRIEMEVRLKATLASQLAFAAKHGERTIEDILNESRIEHQIEHLKDVIAADKARLTGKK